MGSQYDSYSGIRIKPKDFTFLDYILDPYYWRNNVTIPAYTGEFYFDPNNPQIFKDPNGKEWVYITRNSKYAVTMGRFISIAYMWCDGATQDDFDEKLSAGAKSELKLVSLSGLPGSKTLQSIRDGKAVVVSILSRAVGSGPKNNTISDLFNTFDWQNIMLDDYSGETVTKANFFNIAGPTFNDLTSGTLPVEFPTAANIYQNYDLPIWYKRKNNFAQNYLGQPNFTLMQQLGSQSHNKNFMYYIVNGNIQATVPLAAIPYVPAEYANIEFPSKGSAIHQRYCDALKVIVSYRNASVSEATFAERFMALEIGELSGYLALLGFSVFLYDGGQLTFDMNVAMRKYPKLNGFYASIKTPSMCSTKNGLSLGSLELIVAYSTGNSFIGISGLLVQFFINSYYESIYTFKGVVMNGINHLEYAFGLKPKEIDGYSESNGDFCMCGLNFSICFDRTVDKRAATKAIGYNSQKEITKIATQGSETTAKVGNIIY